MFINFIHKSYFHLHQSVENKKICMPTFTKGGGVIPLLRTLVPSLPSPYPKWIQNAGSCSYVKYFKTLLKLTDDFTPWHWHLTSRSDRGTCKSLQNRTFRPFKRFKFTLFSRKDRLFVALRTSGRRFPHHKAKTTESIMRVCVVKGEGINHILWLTFWKLPLSMTSLIQGAQLETPKDRGFDGSIKALQKWFWSFPVKSIYVAWRNEGKKLSLKGHT